MKSWIMQAPVLSQVARALYRKRFEKPGSFAVYGAYPTAAAAREALPANANGGFNNDAGTKIYDERLEHIYSYDYPVLFWLRPLLKSGCLIFDVGGHVGIAYHTYSRYLDLEACSWTVCDLPKIVAEGSRRVAQAGIRNLHFVTDFHAGSGADVLLASGSVQCLTDPPFLDQLAQLAVKPAHILINKMPLHEREEFFFLDNVGAGSAVVQVAQRAAFLKRMEQLGYRLVDAWDNPERGLRIPFYPQYEIAAFAGFYFVWQGSGLAAC